MQPGPQGKRLFRDAANRYETEFNTSPSIQSTVKRLVGEFGDIGLSELSPDRVNTWKYTRLKEASPATVLREVVILKRIMNIATDQWEWCDKNRIRVIENPRVRNNRVRYLSPEEEDQLVAACPAFLANIIIWAIQTGMRRGEIINMRWRDIHNGAVLVEINKEKRTKMIPLTPKATMILDSVPPVGEFVFLNEQGKRLSGGHLEYYFRMAVRRAGLSNLHLHDLRHTCASRLVSRSTPLYQVQALLGHRSPTTTQRYAHLSQDSLREALSESL